MAKSTTDEDLIVGEAHPESTPDVPATAPSSIAADSEESKPISESDKEHRPPMSELQRTFELQRVAAYSAEIKRLSDQYPSIRSLVEEVETLRAEKAKLGKKIKA